MLRWKIFRSNSTNAMASRTRFRKIGFSGYLTKGPCRALCQSTSFSVIPISRRSTRVNRVGSKRGSNNDLKRNMIFSRTKVGLFEQGVASSNCDVNSHVSAYFMGCFIVGRFHTISAHGSSSKRRFLTWIVPKIAMGHAKEPAPFKPTSCL